MLAKSALMTATIKKCLYSALTTGLNYCPFCKFSLWSSQRHCRADGNAGHVDAALSRLGVKQTNCGM